jgi:hypothetical protein
MSVPVDLALAPIAAALCAQAVQRLVHFPAPSAPKPVPATTFRLECWLLKTLSAIDRPSHRTTVRYEVTAPVMTDALFNPAVPADVDGGRSVFASYLRMTLALRPEDAKAARTNLQHCVEFALGGFARFAECASSRALRAAFDTSIAGRFAHMLWLSWEGATLPDQQRAYLSARAAWACVLEGTELNASAPTSTATRDGSGIAPTAAETTLCAALRVATPLRRRRPRCTARSRQRSRPKSTRAALRARARSDGLVRAETPRRNVLSMPPQPTTRLC